jgi:hypothetical protein
MPRAALVCNGSGGGVVPRVDRTLGGLGMEAEGSGEGGDGGCPHGRRRGSLKERVIRVGQWPGQAHVSNLLPGPFECKGKQELSM